jgi:hypothetical protein
MKNIFYKKVFLGLVIIMVLGILSAGCAPPPTTPPTGPPPGPITYTVKIVSAHEWAYGTVYVSGAPTSSILVAWGSTFVYNVPAGAPIWLKDEDAFVSNTKYFNPLFGTTIVFDTWP